MAQIAPSLRRIFPDLPKPLELPPAKHRRYLLQSFSEALARVARTRPQLLVVEDLHWADESMLAFDLCGQSHRPAPGSHCCGHVSGVVDWEGACAGDRAFDLVTLLFYKYKSAAERELLWRYIRDNFDLNTIRVYAAHMIVRQVEWSLRKQTQRHVEHYIAIAHALLADLGS
jgi:hypothetical protein